MSFSADTDEDLAAFRCFFETGGLEVDETDLHGVRTQLHNAAYHNCLRIAEYLLRRNADASLRAEKGYTPLHIAASRGHDHMVGTILKYSSRARLRRFIDAKTSDEDGGFTSLHLAAKKNSYDAVRLLLSFGANFEARDNRGRMPIQLTTLEVVRRLLGSTGEMSRAAILAKEYSLDDLNLRLHHLPGFEYFATTFARNAEGHTPLQVAIHSQHLPTVKTIGKARLLRIAAESLLPSEAKSLAERVLAFWDKIRKVHLGKLKAEGLSERDALREGSYLLLCAWNILRAFEEYRKTLKEPLEEPHVRFVEEVLEVLEFDAKHFQADYDDDYESFFTTARGASARYHQMLCSENEAKRRSCVELLEFAVCTPLERLIKYINSSNLLAAVKKHDAKGAQKCLKRCDLVDVDVQDADGRRSLHYAVGTGDEEMVKLLLSNKANALATTDANETPLHTAVAMGHSRIADSLLRNCDVLKVNDFVNAKIKISGETALHLAAKTARVKIAWTLLEYHAIYCVKDSRGKSPSDVTKSEEMKKLFKFLDEVFDDVKNDRTDVIEKLKGLERDLLLAVGNACDKEGYSAPQVASLNKHRDIGSQIFKMVVEAKKSKDADLTSA